MTKWGHGSSAQCGTHKADDLLAASGITLWVLRQSRIYCKQARMIAKHHEDCCTKLDSHWNPAIINQADRVSEARKNGPEMGRRRQHLLTTRQIQRDNNDRKSDMTWLTTAEDSSKWVALESDFTSSRLKQPARLTTLITTTTTTQQTTRDRTTVTAETCDQNEDDTKDDDEQDGTLLILSQLINSYSSSTIPEEMITVADLLFWNFF